MSGLTRSLSLAASRLEPSMSLAAGGLHSRVETYLTASSSTAHERVRNFAELPKLSHEERRRLAAAIFDLEEEAGLLRDCDRRADEHFRMLVCDGREMWLRPVSLNRLETKLGALTSDEFRALGKQLAALLKLDL